MIEAFGGRKFLYALLAIVLSFVLVILGKVTPSEWITLVEIMGTVYVIGNIGEHVALGK